MFSAVFNRNASLLFLVAICAVCIYPVKAQETLPLGAAAEYNAFVLEDFTVTASDIQGKLAAGGNVTLSSYGLASTISTPPSEYTLISGGNISFNNGQLYTGSMIAAGSVASVSQSVRSGMDAGATVSGNSVLPVDFTAEFVALNTLSQNLSQLPSTGNVDYQWGGAYLEGDCTSPVQVFHLDGMQIYNAHTFSVSCVPTNATLIFNLSGSQPGFTNMSLNHLANNAQNVLYNFYEADEVHFINMGVEGSVLAPNAHMNTNWGQLNGTVIAKSWSGQMELHHVPFTGDLSFLQTAPEFSSTPITQALESELYEYSVELLNTGDDNLNIILVEAPSGLVLNENTLMWQTDYNSAGEYSITLEIEGWESIQQTFTLIVHNVNQSPVITPIETILVAEADLISFQIAANDPDGDSLSYSLVGSAPEDLQLSESGEVTWQTTFSDAGEYSLEIAVTDGELVDQSTFVISISNTNRVPTIQSTPVLTAQATIPYAYSVQATDADGGALIITLEQKPAGMSISATGDITWVPTLADVGTHSISVNVSDGALVATQNYSITVISINLAPSFISTPVTTATENTAYTYNAAATDPNTEDTLTFELLDSPEGMILANGQVQWTPSFEQSGSHNVTLQVLDGELTAEQNFTVLVENVNRAPVISSTPVTTGQATVPYAYSVDATDAEGNALSITLTQKPTAMTITNGSIEWTPTLNDVGVHTIVVDVTDGELTETQTYDLTIISINLAPSFTSVPVTVAIENTEYIYALSATDPNTNDALTFELITAPEGMTLTGNQLQWVPNFEQAGNYNVSVQVSDGELTAQQNFTILTTNVNRAPIITSTPIVTGQATIAYTYQVEAVDADGNALFISLTQKPASMTINATGLIAWAPALSDAGNHVITIQVSDGILTQTQSYTLAIATINLAPSFTSVPVIAATENAAYQYTLTATDPNTADSLTFELTTAPQGMSLIGNQLQWTPNFNQSGNHSVSVQVTDGELTAQQNFTVSVANVNRAPVISSTPITNSQATISYAYQVQATDAEGDTLAITLTQKPMGMTINPAGLIEWTPTLENVGNHTITLEATDGSLTTSQTYVLTIASINLAPSFTSTPITVAVENATYVYALTATDANVGDTLTFELLSTLTGMALTGNQLQWTPSFDQAGSYTVTLQLSDGELTAQQNFTVEVANTNRAPTISSVAITEVAAESTYTYQIDASDVDGDSLSFSLTQKPTSMSISPTGLITWSPAITNVGDNEITLEVSDGTLTATQTYTLIIASNNLPPVIISEPVTQAPVNETYVYQVQAEDPNSGDVVVYELTSSLVGMNIDSQTGLIEWQSSELGVHHVNVKVSDAGGLFTEQNFSIIVIENTLPVTSKGKDFWFMFNMNYNSINENEKLFVFISSEHNTVANLVIPRLNYDETISVLANQVVTIDLTSYEPDLDIHLMGVADNALHITSQDDIVVYILNSEDSTTDGALVSPVNTLGNDYIITTYKEKVNDYGSLYGITATEDDTNISIIESTGVNAGNTIEITLNQGHTYQSRRKGDLTGTQILSDKNIAVFAGNVCSPVKASTCDHLIEQLPPLKSWGSHFFTAPLATRKKGDTFRIYASQDDTYILLNGEYIAHIDRLDYIEEIIGGASVITTNHPALVMQFSHGGSYDKNLREDHNADPFMVLVPPSEQYINHYIIATPADLISDNYLNITAPQSSLNSIRVDGQPIDTSRWQFITGTNFSSGSLSIETGSHTVSSLEPIGLYIYGFDYYDSYGYLGGAAYADNTPLESLTVEPLDSQPVAGDQVCLNAELSSIDSKPITQTQVIFTKNPATNEQRVATELTDITGTATYCYSKKQPGVDIISVVSMHLEKVVEVTWNEYQGGDNVAPNITSLPNLYAVPAEFYSYQVTAQDPNNDQLTYELVGAPLDMQIDPLTGLISWDVSPTLIYENIEVKVSDPQGLSARQKYRLSFLTGSNRYPEITSDPSTSVISGHDFYYKATTTDSDGDRVTYTVISGPPEMTIDSFNDNSGYLRWTPTDEQVGTYTIEIEVVDGNGGIDYQIFDLVVSLNSVPVITSSPITTGASNHYYTYKVIATDADGDLIRYSIVQGVGGLFIDSRGTLRWTPQELDVGSHAIIVEVNDQAGGITQQFYTLDIAQNQLPIVTSTPSSVAFINELNHFAVTVNDSDGDFIRFTLLAGSTGMNMSSGGAMSWAPTLEQLGRHNVVVQLDDQRGGIVEYSWIINVVDDTPQITHVLEPRIIDLGDSALLRVNPTGFGTDLTVSVTSNESTVVVQDDGNGTYQITLTPDNAETRELVITASDGTNTLIATDILKIRDEEDTTAPVVSIDNISHYQSITAPIDIVASVDDSNLESWRVFFSKIGSDATEYTVLAEGSNNITQQVIANFDPTQLENGQYIIALDAVTFNGLQSQANALVIVEGDLKVGNFSLTFEDISIPLAGIPIRVTRTYDTRQKTEALDFGYGWSVGYQDVKVQESMEPTKGWEQFASHSLFELEDTVVSLPSTCTIPIGEKLITITLPNGDVEKFTTRARPVTGGTVSDFDPDCTLVGGRFMRLEFEAQEGTDSTLVSLDGQSLYLSNQSGGNLALDIIETEAVNLTQYQLTTREGFVYNLDQTFGIETVTDPNGNTVTFTENGILHSSGKSITFGRDAEGRITTITDPNNNVVRYTYNANGDLTVVTDAAEGETTFTYNAEHGLLDIIDPLNRNIVRNIYDDDGRLIAQEDNEGRSTSFNHDIEGRQSIVTNRLGHASIFYYDDRGNVTSLVDARGKTTSYTFDDDDNQLSKTDPLLRTTSATYNDKDNQLTQTDGLSNTTSFVYNDRGQETQITDALEHSFDNTYDSVGNLLSIEDPDGNAASNIIGAQGLVASTQDLLGHTTSFTYDSNGNKLTQTDAEGSTTSYTYDDNNNVLTETHTRTVDGAPQTETTTFTYDKLNRVVSTLNALGHTTSTTFDLAGQQTVTIDALNHRMEMDYDAYGRVIETRYEDGTHTNKTYDAEGNLKSETDRNRKTTSFTYDKLNRLTHTFYANSTSTETEYDDAGQVVAEIDANQNRTEFEYDLAGRRTQVKDAQQQTHNFTYDKNGNLKTETDALGHTTTYAYNNLDQKITTTYHNTSEMEQGLDAMGRRTSQTDQADITTSYGYDKLGRLTSVTDIQGNVTSYTYDEMGNKLTQKDAENKTTTWTYDALGRVLTRTLPMLQSESFSYDNNGNMKTHIDFNGDSTSYDYDLSDRVILISYSDGNAEEFIYDDNGNQIGAIQTGSDNVERITSYTFDVMNRLTSETQATGAVLSYFYDDNGNRTKVTLTKDGTSTVTDYVFDSLNRLESVTDNNGTTTYGYDAVGNRANVNYPNLSSEVYTYDNLNRLTRKETFNGLGALVQSFDYTLGETGIRTDIDELGGRSTNYTYDTLYRLTGETITDVINGNYASTYEYDKVGNRTYETVNGVETQYDYDLNDRLSQQGGTTYLYDDNGSTLSETLDGVSTLYTYNTKNKLVSLDKAGVITGYAYNVSGIRTNKESNLITTDFIVDSNRSYAQVLLESDGTNEIIYTYGDDLISQERTGAINYYHYDGLGSTRALSNELGELSDTYDYEAFGELLNSTGSTENDYKFTGEQFDTGLNQYYLRARYYNQGIGRFTQQDTWMGRNSDPITLHKYLYANASPVMYTDPSGQFGLIEASITNNIIGILTTLQVDNAFNTFDTLGVSDSGIDAARSLNKLIGIAMLGAGGVQIIKILSRRCGGKKKNCPIKLGSSSGVGNFWSGLTKVKFLQREYASIGNRLYTRHAVDRLTPRGFGSRGGAINSEKGLGRSVPIIAVEEAINYGSKITETVNQSTRVVHMLGDIQVVTEYAGKIVVSVLRVTKNK